MPWILRFLKQFNDTMIIILLVVALLLYFYGYLKKYIFSTTLILDFFVLYIKQQNYATGRTY